MQMQDRKATGLVWTAVDTNKYRYPLENERSAGSFLFQPKRKKVETTNQTTSNNSCGCCTHNTLFARSLRHGVVPIPSNAGSGTLFVGRFRSGTVRDQHFQQLRLQGVVVCGTLHVHADCEVHLADGLQLRDWWCLQQMAWFGFFAKRRHYGYVPHSEFVTNVLKTKISQK